MLYLQSVIKFALSKEKEEKKTRIYAEVQKASFEGYILIYRYMIQGWGVSLASIFQPTSQTSRQTLCDHENIF